MQTSRSAPAWPGPSAELPPSTLLALSSDGPVSPEAWAAAHAADAAWHAQRTAAPKPASVTAQLRRRARTVQELAEVLIARANASGACTDADLRAAGFTQAELDALLEPARALARSRALDLAA